MSLGCQTGSALSSNVSAAVALQELLRTNLGPKGTMKMLVSGAGDIRVTKEGRVLLREVQLQHPAASLIAKAVTTLGDEVGDGTISAVLIIAEILRQAERYASCEGAHPRLLVQGLDVAKMQALNCLDELWEDDDGFIRKKVARTSLGTKVGPPGLADHLADVVVLAVEAIKPDRWGPIDLNLVEIVEMQHLMAWDTELVLGLVLDHGSRHPGMKKRVEDAYILTLNVSLEYETPEVSSTLFYKDACGRETLARAERGFIEERVRKIVALKEKVCDGSAKGFVVINQKGIDWLSLEELARSGIVALRRAKRRNMQRVPLACGGTAVNSLEDLTEECLGRAGLVRQERLGDRTYTFVENCKNPRSVTVLVKGPNAHTLRQVGDAVRGGLRVVKNVLEDGCAMPGAGAVEIRIAGWLQHRLKDVVKGRAQLGFQAFIDAMLIIPKTLARNAGYDPQEIVLKALEAERLTTLPVGIDLSTGQLIKDWDTPVWDNACVKRQLIETCTEVARNILLVDKIVATTTNSDKN
ncbi:T-complex protein 1 subunit zeta-2-like [Callorhinchus milii]|uniref:T-complex protein 1 subunit zeta-2 n=1 Tax=Callorhinchus milii TaxID=7868 RepID=A0A4W3IZZ2_CALMI|nr:T-complex protein 1 subunit zeta-2-like [Callorhinchus milii]